MNEDYLMRPGDRFIARECGCAFSVLSGPSDILMAVSPPKCCCGHDMIKDPSILGGIDVLDIPEQVSFSTMLPGMVE